jgi:hypothetical protein
MSSQMAKTLHVSATKYCYYQAVNKDSQTATIETAIYSLRFQTLLMKMMHKDIAVKIRQMKCMKYLCIGAAALY